MPSSRANDATDIVLGKPTCIDLVTSMADIIV